MTFDNAQQVDSLVWQMKMADYIRSANRARIQNLFNGVPPYTEEEVMANNIGINVNDLESTRLSHDARSQFYQAFLKPGNYFNATLDSGPKHKRSIWSTIVTKEMNRMMKRSIPYFETMRSKFAMLVLHGIAPSAFRDSCHWCPDPIAVDDCMVPANVILTMRNLPFFATYRSFSVPELVKLTQGPKVDPGWNKKMVDACIEYIDSQSIALMNDNWPDIWSPEKAQERMKQSYGSYYLGDAVPTIKCWDVYFWNDSNKVQGWNRRIVLDSWSQPSMTNGTINMERVKFDGKLDKYRKNFLFNPGDRVWASKRESVINWQFADLSSTAPFYYHSVRSLGFLIYAMCHLQNRLRCRFNEAVMEQMMQLFRVKGSEDIQRVLKVDLINKGFIDENLQFIKTEERNTVDYNLAQLALRQNQDIIGRHASSYTPQIAPQSVGPEKTKYQVMQETQAMTSLVSAAFLQAYQYQIPEYREIFRRFCIHDSADPDCRTFQANCLRQGVPIEMLEADRWELEPERIMGAGNKTLEVTIAEQMLQARNLFDPEPQRDILRDYVLAITDDPARAERLVPENPNPVTDAVLIASLAMGTLLKGLQVPIKTGINHIEYAETLLEDLSMLVKKYQNQVPAPDDIVGMNNVAQHIQQHIQLIAQDPNEKQRVKQYGDVLGKLMNEIRAYAQRYQEQQRRAAEQNGGGQLDPETQAKIQAILINAQTKAKTTEEAHSQRTAQRQIQFEMDENRKQQEWEMEMRRGVAETTQELVHNERKNVQEVKHAKKKAEASSAASKSDG